MKLSALTAALSSNLSLNLSLSLALLTLLPGVARADVDSALKDYSQQNYVTAFKEFSRLAAEGDNHAKSFEAMMLLRGQGSQRDVEGGARLARECAIGGEPTCYAMYAELNLPGRGLPVNFAEARNWTRKAIAGGDLRAGLLLWQTYLLDPANQYIVDGKPDINKYQRLGKRTVAQRADQIEAIDALAGAAAVGYAPARLALVALLIEQSGSGTASKIRSLLADQNDLPDNFQQYLSVSKQVIALGPTRAAPKLISDAAGSVQSALVAAAVRKGKSDASQCKDFRIMSIHDVSAVEQATWLPLTHPLVNGTYPLSGTWQEQWQVFLCGAEHRVQMRFDVDGMGGAYFKATS